MQTVDDIPADPAAADTDTDQETGNAANTGTGSPEKTEEAKTEETAEVAADQQGDHGEAEAGTSEGADPASVTDGAGELSTSSAATSENETPPFPEPSPNTSSDPAAALPVGAPIVSDADNQTLDHLRDGRDSFIRFMHMIGGTLHKFEEGVVEQASEELTKAEGAMRDAVSYCEAHIFKHSPKKE